MMLSHFFATFLTLFLAFFLGSPLTQAALSTGLSVASLEAVPFYRSSESLFPSGQASRNVLEARLVRSELEVHYKVRWDQKDYNLSGKEILRDIQVSKNVLTRSSVQVLTEKKSTANTLETLDAGAALIILDCDDYWAKVQNPVNKKIGFLPLVLLQSKNEDSGYFVNLIDSYLRKSTKQNSDIITTIPRLTRLEVLHIEKGWIQVRYKDFLGYADINHFVSRADFANLAYHPKYQWLPVTHRENDQMVSNKKHFLPLQEIWGMVTNPARAVMIDNHDVPSKPTLRAYLDLVKPEAHIWGISLIEGHGEVWWQKNNLLSTEKLIEEPSITTAQLLKKKIFSIAFESKNSLRGLVSADGIFQTDDGIKWLQIAQFGTQNYPVNINPNGTRFVGSYRSLDKGKSFDPFIRWDLLAQAIELSQHRSPRILKITRIESLAHSQIEIQVDTGTQHLSLRSGLNDDNWSVVKN